MRAHWMAGLLLLAACKPIVERSLKPQSGVAIARRALDPARQTAVAAFLDRKGGAIDALVIAQDGVVLFADGTIARNMNLASARKSVLSLLYGIAVDKGLIDLDATLAELRIDETHRPLSAREPTATIRHLLQSRAGVYLPADAEGFDSAKTRPPRGRDAPGDAFHYTNWGFNVLGAIFEQETGLPIGKAFAEWVARPTGMQDFHPSHIFFSDRRSGSDYPAYRMFLSARDLARLGVLVAQDGRWNGQQIVSAAWIADSATAWSPVGPPLSAPPISGYGLSRWVDPVRGDMVASGWGGQMLYIGRSDGVVVVMLNDTGNTALSHLWFRWFGALQTGAT